MPSLIKKYSPYQFTLIRILLGSYLFYIFLLLFPYAQELFSNDGVLVPWSQSEFVGSIVPDFLFILAEPQLLSILFCLLLVCAALLVVGFYRRLQALVLWFGWMLLVNFNTFSLDPSTAFIGLLLLAYVVIPGGEPLTLRPKKSASVWYMPAILYWGFWLVWVLSFTISGYEKYQSDIWRNGTAALYLSTGVVSLDTFVTQFLSYVPTFITSLLTWFILYTQLTAVIMLPLSVTRQFFLV